MQDAPCSTADAVCQRADAFRASRNAVCRAPDEVCLMMNTVCPRADRVCLSHDALGLVHDHVCATTTAVRFNQDGDRLNADSLCVDGDALCLSHDAACPPREVAMRTVTRTPRRDRSFVLAKAGGSNAKAGARQPNLSSSPLVRSSNSEHRFVQFAGNGRPSQAVTRARAYPNRNQSARPRLSANSAWKARCSAFGRGLSPRAGNSCFVPAYIAA